MSYQAIPGQSPNTILTNNVRCWNQWRTDKFLDVLRPSGAYEKIFWWFLDLGQFVNNWSHMLDKKFDIQLKQIQANSF